MEEFIQSDGLLVTPSGGRARSSWGKFVSLTPPRLAHSPSAAAEEFLALLTKLPATRERGLEGLVSTLIEDITDHALRGTTGGFQEGGDASSADGSGLLKVEVKRYRSGRPNANALRGKLLEASQSVAGRPAVWVLVQTVPIGSQLADSLTRAGESLEIQVVILDGAGGGGRLPDVIRLAIAAPAAFRRWLARFHPRRYDAADRLIRILESHPGSGEIRNDLRKQLEPGLATLHGLKSRMTVAYCKALADKGLALALFKQRLTLLAPDSMRVSRAAASADLAAAVSASRKSSDNEVVLVLGEEGVGKTWAVVEYWLECLPEALFIFISARDVYEGQDPSQILFAALSRAAGEHRSDILRSLLDRLLRGERTGLGPVLFVLDGLNENPTLNWAQHLIELRARLRNIRATLIVTCRPRAWRADYGERVDFRTLTVEIKGYTTEELRTAVSAHGYQIDAFPPEISAGLRNPRFCALAMQLAARLGPQALTPDRVFWEYWRDRLTENQALKHGTAQFNDLLRRHARDVLHSASATRALERLRSPTFDIRNIGSYSRIDPQLLRGDLSEIVEGLYFSPVGSRNDDQYEFRPAAMLFALGLELVGALERPSPVDTKRVETVEQLARIVEPVQAFDKTADILVSALAVACLKRDTRIIAALLREILDLQNRDDRLIDSFASYVSEALDEYLEVAEEVAFERTHDEWLVWAIRRAMADRRTNTTAYGAIVRWLAGKNALSSSPKVDSQQESERLQQLAFRCLSGMPLAGIEGELRSLVERATRIQRFRNGGSDVGWLCLANEVDYVGDAQLTGLVAEGVRPDMGARASKPHRSRNHEYLFCGVSRFLGAAVMNIESALRELIANSAPDDSVSPFSGLYACRLLEAALVALPVEHRVPILARLPLPSDDSETDNSWPVRTQWRPTLGVDGPSEWIVKAADNDTSLHRALLYLKSQNELTLTSQAEEIIWRHLYHPYGHEPGDLFGSAAAIALRSPELVTRFSRGHWSAAEEASYTYQASVSSLLARATAQAGIYEEVRPRILVAALCEVLTHAHADDLPQVIEDLEQGVEGMIAFALNRLERPLTLVAGVKPVPLEELGSETSIQPYTKLPWLSPKGVDRLISSGRGALRRIVDSLVDYTAQRNGTSAPDAFAYSLLPGLSRHDPDSAAALLRGLLAKDARRQRLRDRARFVPKHELVAVLEMQPTPQISVLRQDLALRATDDAGLLTLCQAGSHPGCHAALVDIVTGLVQSPHFGCAQRGAFLATLADISAPKSSFQIIPSLQRAVDRVCRDRDVARTLLDRWMTRTDGSALEIENELLAAVGYFHLDRSGLDQADERHQLLTNCLGEAMNVRRTAAHTTLCGLTAPAAWMITLNAAANRA